MSIDNKWKFDTLVIHGAQTPEQWKSSTLAPIYQTASHRFDTAEELSDVFAGKKPGFIYQRLRNPTNEILEKRLSLLEHGVDAVGEKEKNNVILIFHVLPSDALAAGKHHPDYDKAGSWIAVLLLIFRV